MRKKLLMVSALSLVLVGFVSGATLAFYHAQTGEIVNTFKPEKVTVDIDENFSNNIKSNVKVTNTSDYVDVYVRITMNSYFIDNEGNQLFDEAPYPEVSGANWKSLGNHVYEYTKALKPGQSTTALFEPYTLQTTSDKRQVLEFASQAIQATDDAKADWGA